MIKVLSDLFLIQGIPEYIRSDNGPEFTSRAMAAISKAVSEGELTPGKAETISKVVEVHRKAIETEDHEKRLARLEAKQKRGR